MTKKDLQKYTISPKTTLLDAAGAIVSNASRCVFVVDEGKVLGALSEGDILKALLKNVSPYAPIETSVNSNFKYLKKRSYPDALEIVKAHNITLIPVVDEKLMLKDIITLKEVLDNLK